MVLIFITNIFASADMQDDYNVNGYIWTSLTYESKEMFLKGYLTGIGAACIDVKKLDENVDRVVDSTENKIIEKFRYLLPRSGNTLRKLIFMIDGYYLLSEAYDMLVAGALVEFRVAEK